MKNFYAHSLPNRLPENWQPLEDHLQNVAELARNFAKAFGGDQWAYLAGLWHDIGKYSKEFQAKLYAENEIESHLETKPKKVIHSEAGGHLASLKGWNGADRILSWLIMGHHTGLTDFSTENIGAKALDAKMKTPSQSNTILANAPDSITNQPMPNQLIPKNSDPAFFIRMLFSCIVDADFLDTETFMNKGKALLRQRQFPGLESLLVTFNIYINKLCQDAEPSSVNKIRAEVLEQCQKAAEHNPSVFSLTVPTGGGKTLSSLAFALRHAVKYKKNRIIYVIPYTSIIEQTADVFRKIPGFEHAIIEHHSNIAETNDDQETNQNRLAAENWDAPLIITTSVQFFESLYACKTSRCRKLHNIVNSIVIFDEAQSLPPSYLRPSVFAIRELYKYYQVTPVLCTATQPVLTQTKQFDFNFKEGFEKEPIEIVADPNGLETRLERVVVKIFPKNLEPIENDMIAKSILSESDPVLCILNRKDHVRQLTKLLPEERTFHLSTNMAAEHRSDVLAKIKERLKLTKNNKSRNNNLSPFYAISTSLVEAGVDIDFPVVYRAISGLDSIAQAAGRCNREGDLSEKGKTIVFLPVEQPGYVQQAASIARELLKNKELSNLLSLKNYQNYFKQRFWQLGETALDKKNILHDLSGQSLNFYFRTAAQNFNFIEDGWQESVIAPYGKAADIIAGLTAEPWNQRKYIRQLNRFTVAIPKYLINALASRDYIRETGYPGLFMLDYTIYDDTFGFIPPEESDGIDPDKFFI